MKRTLVISVEVGDAAPSGCGQCPFKVVDYDMGGPRGGALLCTNPAWHVDDVTVRRRDECVKAEENAGSLEVARVAYDCGQSGPCAAKAPGCARHFMERVAELRAEVEHWKSAAKEHAEACSAARTDLAAARAAVGEAWFVGGVSLAEAITRKCQRLEELVGEREP